MGTIILILALLVGSLDRDVFGLSVPDFELILLDYQTADTKVDDFPTCYSRIKERKTTSFIR